VKPRAAELAQAVKPVLLPAAMKTRVNGRDSGRYDPTPSRVGSGDVATPDEVREALDELAATMSSIEAVLDIPGQRRAIAELEREAAAPDLWSDQEHAQDVTSRLSRGQADIDRVTELRQRLDDLSILVDLGVEESDPETLLEAEQGLARVRPEIEALEVRTLLSGEYDDRDALVTIRSEAGGVDAADFAEMLLRMYLRWADRHHFPVDVMDTSYAEEAGLKSATFTVKAPFAYGTLSVEQGTHRLVRISPFDNQGRRQTSFAGVEVLPVTEEADHIDIPESDIRVDVFRSSGPGGQSVNTTDSAVRITHLPTSIVVTCQNEKSQLQNKAAALRVLQSRLLDRAREEKEAELRQLKGDGGNSWGSQMRSYVLHPYQMVKDLRTDYEVGNPAAVFDGDIDGFIDAGIRWRRQQEPAR
jgi:peptide chain release factor 2